MTEINKSSVLKAFAAHQILSWPDFAEKNIFINYHGGTARAKQLNDTIKQLENERLIIRLDNIVPPTWQLLDTGLTEHRRLTEALEHNSLKETIEFDNLKLDNWQKRNWFWLTIGGFLLGIISTLLIESVKTKYLDTYSKNTPVQVNADTSSSKKVR